MRKPISDGYLTPPRQGQANHFALFAKEKIPYGIQRYVGETERLYGILDTRLRDRDYIVGPGRGKYSIADIALLGWVNGYANIGGSFDDFPAVKAWLARLWERPAVQKGFNVPLERKSGLAEVDEKTKRDRAEVKALVDKAKEQYGYKYSSP